MNTVLFSAIDADTQTIWARWNLTPGAQERLIIFGAIGFVTALVLLWAALVRKKRRRRRSHHHSHSSSSRPAEAPEAPKAEATLAPPEKRRRTRRSRRRHRPRNPTLAETGGLPPVRPGSPQDFLP
jgi:hypothetical protein